MRLARREGRGIGPRRLAPMPFPSLRPAFEQLECRSRFSDLARFRECLYALGGAAHQAGLADFLGLKSASHPVKALEGLADHPAAELELLQRKHLDHYGHRGGRRSLQRARSHWLRERRCVGQRHRLQQRPTVSLGCEPGHPLWQLQPGISEFYREAIARMTTIPSRR
jgi:hypothetical protein